MGNPDYSRIGAAEVQSLADGMVPEAVVGYVSTVTTGAWETVLSVTGRGVLRRLVWKQSANNGQKIRLTVDGVVLYDQGPSSNNTYWYQIAPAACGFRLDSGTGMSADPSRNNSDLRVAFETSLLVEVYVVAGVHNVAYAYDSLTAYSGSGQARPDYTWVGDANKDQLQECLVWTPVLYDVTITTSASYQQVCSRAGVARLKGIVVDPDSAAVLPLRVTVDGVVLILGASMSTANPQALSAYTSTSFLYDAWLDSVVSGYVLGDYTTYDYAVRAHVDIPIKTSLLVEAAGSGTVGGRVTVYLEVPA